MKKLMLNKVFVTSSLGVFGLVFIWALLAGLLVQLVVLPALPGLHAGHGLMVGGDWVEYHRDAVKLVGLMQQQGWEVWELRPRGNAPIGIAAAVYFFVGIGEPWVLLPINAAMFALAAVCLHGILKMLVPERWAFAAILPFVLFPSAALIYSQIHKDVFSIAGTLVVALVWGRFARLVKSDGWSVLTQLALMVTGCTLTWVVRPYLLQPLTLASVLVVLVLIGRAGRRRGVAWWIGILLCLLVAVGYNKFLLWAAEGQSSVQAVPTVSHAESTGIVANALAKLSAARAGFALGYPDAGSNIDVDVKYDTLIDLVLYVPRALQVGLLAPFPSMWGSDGVSPGSALMRFIAGGEMVVSYVLFIGVVLLWFDLKSNRLALVVAMLIAMVLILVLALVVSNVGTLYRMRYNSWQILNGLGVLGWGLRLQTSRKGKSA
jgi:hypothetical protein